MTTVIHKKKDGWNDRLTALAWTACTTVPPFSPRGEKERTVRASARVTFSSH
jgi:hypothetical protein